MSSSSNLNCKSEIYMITNVKTGKKYVGQTKCISGNRSGGERRLKDHIYDAGTGERRGATALVESIREHGADAHTVETILICDFKDADEHEIKYIIEHNTHVPNGLNITKGGKKAKLEEETKKKLSEAMTGKLIGELNPMFGKHHSEETRKLIKESQIGRALPLSQKENMSKAHVENKAKGILPSRRNDETIGLPKYVYHVINADKEGYEIRNHPKLKQKQFVAKSVSLEENLKRAQEYLADEDNINNAKTVIEYATYTDLPRYLRHVKAEKYEGFEVKNHPVLKNKKWTSSKNSMEEKLKIAKEYLTSAPSTSTSSNSN